MNITYSCPACQRSLHLEFSAATEQLDCPHCKYQIAIPRSAIAEDGIHRCLACPSRDLYVRKDIPQRLGVGIVAAGILASSIAWAYHHVYWTFAILFATAFIDFVLFFIVGNSLMCYRCGAQYRGLEMESHGAFDLETHERHRQLTARLAQSPTPKSQRSA